MAMARHQLQEGNEAAGNCGQCWRTTYTAWPHTHTKPAPTNTGPQFTAFAFILFEQMEDRVIAAAGVCPSEAQLRGDLHFRFGSPPLVVHAVRTCNTTLSCPSRFLFQTRFLPMTCLAAPGTCIGTGILDGCERTLRLTNILHPYCTCSIYSVYDGHGGDAVSVALASQLHTRLSAALCAEVAGGALSAHNAGLAAHGSNPDRASSPGGSAVNSSVWGVDVSGVVRRTFRWAAWCERRDVDYRVFNLLSNALMASLSSQPITHVVMGT